MLNLVQIQKYGTTVIANEDGERFRKEECLCLNCLWLEEGCEIAKQGLAFAQANNVAFAMTRCPKFEYQCPACKGRGEHPSTSWTGGIDATPPMVTCKNCEGRGLLPQPGRADNFHGVILYKCQKCKGEGHLFDQNYVRLAAAGGKWETPKYPCGACKGRGYTRAVGAFLGV